MKLIVLFVGVVLLLPDSLRAEQSADISARIIDSNRDHFAKLYRDAYGEDSAAFVSCTSSDEQVGLVDFYLFFPPSPSPPLLVHFDRERFKIENFGTVQFHEGRVDMWEGRGGNGAAELQRIVVEPLLKEPKEPKSRVVDVFMQQPEKKCAFTASPFFQRPAVAAPK